MQIVDLHTHVIPGVDDGARDVEEALAALRTLREAGVRTVVATPHIEATRTERPAHLAARLTAIDEAFAELQDAVRKQGPEVGLERGAEVRLNAPAPDLTDPRLRLAGTRFVLVEFTGFQIPPYGSGQLEEIREAGWLPVLAHPERYGRLSRSIEVAARWREYAYLQVNAGSLVGRYGPEARSAARQLLERGWVDYLCSDFHARGRPFLDEARFRLSGAGVAWPSGAAFARAGRTADAETGAGDGERTGTELELVRLLMAENPARLLQGREPLPVPPWPLRRGLAARLRRLLRRRPGTSAGM
ncbi:MAG: tyrosine-protein phosphatase [Gemmatimonadota bacterium]